MFVSFGVVLTVALVPSLGTWSVVSQTSRLSKLPVSLELVFDGEVQSIKCWRLFHEARRKGTVNIKYRLTNNQLRLVRCHTRNY